MKQSATNRESAKPTSAGLLAMWLALVSPVALASPLIFTVANTADSGVGSLRKAIADANANAGPDTIQFNIPGADSGCGAVTHVCTIKPLTLLDNITSPVTIDGYSQPLSSANSLPVGDNAKLLIELDATNISPAFRFEGAGSGSSIVKGLAITHLASVGILIADGSSNNAISGNFIGVNVAGTAASIISSSSAVSVQSASEGNTIGGTAPAARNLLFGSDEIVIVSGSNDSVIQGNYINIDKDGANVVGVSGRGIDVGSGSGNLIGGSSSGAGNVIGAWLSHGIIFQGSGSNNLIQGNRVGTDATGTVLLGGGVDGITYFLGTGTGNKIGGSSPGEGNQVNGATAAGVLLYGGTSADLVVQGNWIGTDVTGTLPLANATGIQADGETGGLIGGTVAGAGNRIAFNSSIGVNLTSSAMGVAILGNSIFANGSLGISLSGGGVPTSNDAGDVDTGSNNLQNYPVIGTVTFAPNTTAHISGTLNSEANKTYRLEFFANASCDPSHNGQGKRLLITPAPTFVTTNPNDVAFGPLDITVPADRHVITATATDPSGNTSELSACSTQDTIFSDGLEGD